MLQRFQIPTILSITAILVVTVHKLWWPSQRLSALPTAINLAWGLGVVYLFCSTVSLLTTTCPYQIASSRATLESWAGV